MEARVVGARRLRRAEDAGSGQGPGALQQTAAWRRGRRCSPRRSCRPTRWHGRRQQGHASRLPAEGAEGEGRDDGQLPEPRPQRAPQPRLGPPKYVEKIAKQTDLFPQGPKGPNQVVPFLPFASDPKPYTYAGATMHGNGFFVTELTSGAPIGLPRGSRVTFSTPGTYKFFCWIHGPDMGGTVVVTP